MANYGMSRDENDRAPRRSSFPQGSSVQEMKDPYGKDFRREPVESDDDISQGDDDYAPTSDEPVYRLRYEFVRLLEGLEVDFDTKYRLMRGIDDIIERHDLSDY